MQIHEWDTIVSLMNAAFPRQDFPAESAAAYFLGLRDLGADEVMAAVQKLARTDKWLPSIAEIRTAVRESRVIPVGSVDVVTVPRPSIQPGTSTATLPVDPDDAWTVEGALYALGIGTLPAEKVAELEMHARAKWEASGDDKRSRVRALIAEVGRPMP